MKGISLILALAATCGLSALAFGGCGSEEPPIRAQGNDSGTTDPACLDPKELKDPLNPPVDCPAGGVCSSTEKVKDCPNNDCMFQSEQSGTTKNFRMGRIRLFAPEALLSLASIAVDPNVNPKCANGGSESFTWLLQFDTAAKTVKTGGARASTDGGKTFAFLTETVNAKDIGDICPGFVGPEEPVNLSPVTSKYDEANGKINTPKIDRINVPIFDTSGKPIILPLREAHLKDVTINGSCIGKFQKDRFSCNGESLGWTTGGAIIAKITADDADRVPVKTASCQSLCAILANDATKTDGKVCKKGPDGKVMAGIGTHCVGGEGCKNAFLLSATFGAYGIEITASAPPPDGGTDGGSDAASDAAGD